MLPSPALLLLLPACASKPSPVRRAVRFDAPVPSSTPDEVAALPASPAWLGHRRIEGAGLVRAPVERWRVRLGGPVTGELAVHDGAVWAVAGGEVACVEADGAVRFRVGLDATGSVASTDEGAVVGARDGALLALSPTTGAATLAWPGSGRPRGRAVPLGRALAWLTADGALRLTDGAVHPVALSAAGGPSSDGQQAWFHTLDGELWAVGPTGPAWRATVPGPGVGSPVVLDELVIAAWDTFQGQPGGVQALDRQTGARRWIYEAAAPPTGGLALGRLLLVPLVDGTLLALDPATGEVAWEAILGRDPLSTAPLVAGSSAWVGDAGGRLHRVDLDDGGVAWSYALGTAASADPAWVGDTLVIGLASGDLVGLAEQP